MTIKSKLTAGLFAAAFALGAVGAQAETVKLSTGSQGGSWYPLGGAIKAAMEEADSSLEVAVTPGGGIANVVGVEAGKFPVAFANSPSTVDAMSGKAPFKKAVKNVCNVATLYPQYFQIISLKSAEVKSFADFKGRAITTQPKGNTGEQLTRELLGLNGLSYDELDKVHFASYKDSVSLMKDGHADVFLLGTALPAGAVMDLASARDIAIVPMDDETLSSFQSKNGAFQKRMITAGSYPGIDSDVPALAYATHIIAACDYSEEVIGKMLTAIADNLDSLSAVNKNLKTLSLAEMGADIGVPMEARTPTTED